MILTPEEKMFLDVFLNEATTEPFGGPATRILRERLGLGYAGIPNILTAYQRDNPLSTWPVGHRSEVSPPLPWPDRDTALSREHELAAALIAASENS
jgi:hypothetical protein